MAEVSFHIAAEAEYEAALAWYLARSPRAASGFEAAIDRAVRFMESFPEASPLCDDRHRYCALRRYPYELGWSTEWTGGAVRVVAVPHDGQLPGYWIGRV